MKNSIKKIVLAQVFMLLIIFLNFFTSSILNEYNKFIFLGLMLIAFFLMFGIDFKKSINEKRILINILIYILSYFIITYLVGLFIGFNKTIYHFGFSNFKMNILPLFVQIVLVELLRYYMIKKSNKNKYVIILSFLIFTLLEISLSLKLYNFNILDDIYEFIGLIILANISKNIFLTILCINTDFLNNIIYRLIMELYVYIIPIVPAFGPYISSVLLIIFPIILSIMVISVIKNDVIDKPKNKNFKKILYIILIAFILFIVSLNSGFFKYQTLTIGSDSMKDYLEKGDVIVIDRISKNKKRNLKKGDILIFRYDNKIVSHRIYQVIKRDNNVFYRTKGDNNDQIDTNIVEIDDIIGIEKIKIKYVGLPSIWLKELLE